jgi:hypothetical protein
MESLHNNYISLYGFTDLGHFFNFSILCTVGRTPWTGDQPDAWPLPTHRTAQTQNKRIQTCTPWVVFEPTIPLFEREKTVNALDRAATVIGNNYIHYEIRELEESKAIFLQRKVPICPSEVGRISYLMALCHLQRLLIDFFENLKIIWRRSWHI